MSNGDFVVSWQSYDQDGSAYGVFAQRFDAQGTKKGDEFQVNLETNNNQMEPYVIGLPDDTFWIFWESAAEHSRSSQHHDLYAQRYANDGSLIGSNIKLTDNYFKNNTEQRVFDVALLDSGDFVTAWHSSSDHSIYLRIFDANGSAKTEEIMVTVNASETGLRLDVVTSEGGFKIAWTSFGEGLDLYQKVRF